MNKIYHCKECGHDFEEPEVREIYLEYLFYCPRCGEKLEDDR